MIGVDDSMTATAGLRGLNVMFWMDYDLFDDNREAAIAQAKVVLNIHYYDGSALEVHRINYLLCKAKCVLSERSSDPTLDSMYLNKIVMCNYEEMPMRAVELAMNHNQRASLEYAGFTFMQREHSDPGHVREALSASGFLTSTTTAPSWAM